MSESNALTRPLGPNTPLPGGDQIDTPQPRLTLPGGSPGGGGSHAAGPSGPATEGGIGDQQSPMSFDGSRRTLTQEHQRNKAVYEVTSKALKQVDAVRKSLDRLQQKQDVVKMDDLIEEAGKLVAHGIDPMALAGILADAPQEGGGEALGNWVSGHAQAAEQAEQGLMLQNRLAKHNIGVSASHLLMAHANSQSMMGPLTPPTAPQSDLAQQPDTSDQSQDNPLAMKG